MIITDIYSNPIYNNKQYLNKNQNQVKMPVFRSSFAEQFQKQLTQNHLMATGQLQLTPKLSIGKKTNMIEQLNSFMKEQHPLKIAMFLPTVKNGVEYLQKAPLLEILGNGPTMTDCSLNSESEISDTSRLIKSAVLRLAAKDSDPLAFMITRVFLYATSLELPEATEEEMNTPEYSAYEAAKEEYAQRKSQYRTFDSIQKLVHDYENIEKGMVKKLSPLPAWSLTQVNRVNDDWYAIHKVLVEHAKQLENHEKRIQSLEFRMDKVESDIRALKQSMVTLYNIVYKLNQKIDNEIAHNARAHARLNEILNKTITYCDDRMSYLNEKIYLSQLPPHYRVEGGFEHRYNVWGEEI